MPFIELAHKMSAPGRDLPPRYGGRPCLPTGPLALVFLVMLGSGAVLFSFDPSHFHFYPVCLFHQATGLLCPGCGGLRAAHQLLHGHVTAALHFNMVLVLCLPLMGWIATRLAYRWWQNQPPLSVVRPAWLWCGLTLMLAFGVLRNLPFAQLAWLAPQ